MRSNPSGASVAFVQIVCGVLLLLLALVLTSCPTSRQTERCVIVASEHGTELSPASENPVRDAARVVPSHVSPVRCSGNILDPPSDAGAPFLPDDPVDDLTAILHGRARVDGQVREVCPAFPRLLQEEPVGIRAPPCGPSACPNRQYRAWMSGLDVSMVFYDDPGLRRPERATETPSGACYYRLLALSLAWDGIAPQ